MLAREPVPGSRFAAALAPAWAVATAVTAAFVALVFWRGLRESCSAPPERRRAQFGPGGVGIAAAAVLVLVLARPALPVLGLGLLVALAARLRRRELLAAANPGLLLGVLALAVALGTAARALGPVAPGAGRWGTAWLAAGASVLVNNLPAAVLLSAHVPAHPRALLLGLDLGPNLAVTGSLSAVLWLQVARQEGARPSARRYTLLGLALVPLSLGAALLVSAA